MRKHPHSGRRKTLLRLGVAVMCITILVVAPFVVNFSNLIGLLASSISSLTGSPTTLFFTPSNDQKLFIGDTESIDITINTMVPINALGATISYPKDMLEIVSISKEKSFLDLWTEDTVIAEAAGEIHFSGGTEKPGGLVGTGTVLTLMVRAKTIGSADLEFKNVQVYPSNDTGKSLETQLKTLTLTIAPGAVTPTGGGGTLMSYNPPNPDLNGDGKINLIDLSILTFKMLGPYNPRYDLNSNGSIGLDDLSILLSKM